MVSSFRYFRELESRWGAIADPLEGATELKVPKDYIVTEQSEKLKQINEAGIGLEMFKQFVRVESGGVIDLSGASFVHQLPDTYIFSASWGCLDQLKTNMCDSAERPYRACLKIRSLHRLEHQIFDEGRILELGVPFSQVFERGQRGIVRYEARANSLPAAVLPPSALIKAPRFEHQQEARVTFLPRGPIDHQRITISIPRPLSVFKMMF